MPIQDANSVALKAVQAAGEDGGVVLNFTPPEALKILQAAQQQGLQDRVKWACSTPCNTDFLAEALGTTWDDKLGRQRRAEPDQRRRARHEPLPRRAQEVRARHPARELQPDGLPRGARSRRRRCSTIEGDDYTVETVNEAFKNVKDFKTDMLCKPWYFGEAPLHIPNNTDSDGDAEGRHDGREGGLLRDLRRGRRPIKQVRDIEKKDGLYQPVE